MNRLYQHTKGDLIRSSLIVFATRSHFNQTDLDSILRKIASKSGTIDPSCAVDHIRLGMVDLGLVARSTDGSVYSLVEDSLMTPANIGAMFGENYPAERISSLQHLRKKMKILLDAKLR